MIIHLVVINPLLLAPVAFGLLTIFGRGKKKDDKDDEGYETNKASPSQNTSPQTPTPSPAPASPSPYGPYNANPSPSPRSSSEEENSLNKLLQSLLQDMPFNPPGQNETSSSGMTSTPDWVPPRITPRSRPMTIAQGDKELTPMRPEETPAQTAPVTKPVQPEPRPVPETVKPLLPPPVQPLIGKAPGQTQTLARQFIPAQNLTVENVQTAPPVRPFIPEQNTTPGTPRPTQPNVQPQIAPFRPQPTVQPQPPVQPQVPTVRPLPSMQPQPPVQLQPSKTEPEDEEVKTPSKPVKMEKAELKQEPPKKASATPQTFEHIFDLTQGTLRTPGLVIINGPAGSGKTSLASNLAGAYLKSGTPCLLVTYDQSPSSLRDTIKQSGWEAQQFESQYKLVMVDGFSGQSDMMSFEPYYVEKPFDMDALGQTLTSNTQIFMGDKIAIIFDSMTGLASHGPSKEFLGKFREMLEQLKGSAVTLVVTLDIGQLSKDVTGPLEDQANCVIDLSKDGQNGQLKVRKLNGTVSKSEPEEFEIEAGKGLLFV